MFLEIILTLLISTISIAAIFPILDRSIHFGAKLSWLKPARSFKCTIIKQSPPYNLKQCSKANSEIETIQILTRSDSGISLIETIFSITIGATMLAAMNNLYTAASNHNNNLNKELKIYAISSRVQSEITRLFQLIDNHPLFIKPKVHSKGQILLQNGNLNAVLDGSIKFRPSIQSDAITNTKIEMQFLADIKSCRASENILQGQACLRYLNSASTSDYQSFLLISTDGMYEGLGSFKGAAKCKDFNITLGESMLFKSPAANSICTERILIPLDFIQTIYQSQTGEFRLLTHRLNMNVENQPLTIANPALQLSLILNSTDTPWNLELKINKKLKTILSDSIVSQFEKQPVENFLFNDL